jgi:hypothetical protein
VKNLRTLATLAAGVMLEATARARFVGTLAANVSDQCNDIPATCFSRDTTMLDGQRGEVS